MEIGKQLDECSGLEFSGSRGARDHRDAVACAQRVDHKRAVVRDEMRSDCDRRHAIPAREGPGRTDRRKHDAFVMPELAYMPGMTTPRQIGWRSAQHALVDMQG